LITTPSTFINLKKSSRASVPWMYGDFERRRGGAAALIIATEWPASLKSQYRHGAMTDPIACPPLAG